MRQQKAVATWRRTGLPGGRVIVLLATLAGLFAMHGMSDHGTMRHGPVEMHGSDSTGHHAAIPVGGAGATGVHVNGSLAGDMTESGDLHAAMGLCLAILAGAVLLSLRRAGLMSYPLSSALPTDSGLRLVPSLARAPDPPDLHALSIQRC